ncbi:hypothetical protein VH1709_contig00012-0008 [Vibrio harveyi]|uniref:hypothetical protein n=1 Tax=Vibrio harveyi TaxID=669 RepID=UPI000D785075|nr:hypothetical protein [Vibrio harveyi]GBK97856.1 hypothetical protein VH1709_contig00012-0008 [Vibrio harveyi]
MQQAALVGSFRRCAPLAITHATEISLTENVTRAAMYPVDEFEAYSTIIEGGATVEAVAHEMSSR